jgi:hypothetical protein
MEDFCPLTPPLAKPLLSYMLGWCWGVIAKEAHLRFLKAGGVFKSCTLWGTGDGSANSHFQARRHQIGSSSLWRFPFSQTFKGWEIYWRN